MTFARQGSTGQRGKPGNSAAVFVAGRQTWDQTSPVAIGVRPINPSAYVTKNRTITLYAWLEVTAGCTANLELYNVTDSVSVHTFTSTSSTGEMKSQVLTVPTNLPNSSKVYALRLSRSGGNSGDTVACKSAYVEITYS